MSFAKGFLAALVGSLVANAVLLFALRPLVIDPAMPLNALSIGPVATLTVLGVVGATVVYAMLRRFLDNPNAIFMWLALVVLIISFVPDVMIIGQKTGMFAGGTVGTAVVLAVMHVVTAVVVVFALTRLWAKKAR